MVSDNPLQQVRESANWVNEHSENVKINFDKINEFLDNLKKDDYESKSSTVLFPLNYSNSQQEINFWFLLDLINFGSGYRKELHEACNRGAYETICYGLMGMFLSQGGKLTANFLSNMSLNDVSQLFNIPTQEEFEIQAGIYSYRDTPLKQLVQSIHTVLKESSEIVLKLGFQDFGDWIWSITDPSKRSSSSSSSTTPLASDLIKILVETIPAFNDQAIYKDHRIFIFKKVQLLAADLYRRFKDTIPDRFNFTDINDVTVFTDNVLPAVLRNFGILEVSKELEERLNAGGELLPGNDEVELRVQAIQACIEIVSIAKKRTDNFIKNDVEFDYYLWTKGKDGAIRKVERHYTKKTIFY
ncbi:hypothetical protein ACTFIZ_006654 [Dictyostelium cf. discoideum]